MQSQTAQTTRRFEEQMARAEILGRARVSPIARRFGTAGGCPSLETAKLVERNQAFVERLLFVANRMRQGGGIAAVTPPAATMRTGNERTQALLLTFEIGRLLAEIAGPEVFAPFWDAAVVRGCLARSIAMNYAPTVVRSAFLVGVLQDVALPLLASARTCESAGINHVPAGQRLLRNLGLWNEVLDAVGRHHVHPPVRCLPDRQVRLWQIAYVTSLIPGSIGAIIAGARDAVRRILADDPLAARGAVDRLARQTREEYEDIAALYSPFAPPGGVAAEMLDAVRAMIGGDDADGRQTASLRLDVASHGGSCLEREVNREFVGELPPFIATIS